ncbi:MAG: IS3 family transposase, partial [Lentisphaeria bacterium]|nr:IS3 family transposase [Lentisphaeria bacterium]
MENFIRAIKTECLDKMIFTSEAQLRLAVKEYIVEVNKTKRQNSPTLKNSQKFVKWGQWFNTRSNSEKVINFEITDFSMYGDFLPKI